jgi:hypothetical protein
MDWTGCIEAKMPLVSDTSDQWITARRYTEPVALVHYNKKPFLANLGKNYPMYIPTGQA